jgi:hypothetical protein
VAFLLLWVPIRPPLFARAAKRSANWSLFLALSIDFLLDLSLAEMTCTRRELMVMGAYLHVDLGQLATSIMVVEAASQSLLLLLPSPLPALPPQLSLPHSWRHHLTIRAK